MGKFNNKIMAEFNPPRKWTLGRDLAYTSADLTVDEIDSLKGGYVESADDKVLLMKLYRKAMSVLPGSQKQKEICIWQFKHCKRLGSFKRIRSCLL